MLYPRHCPICGRDTRVDSNVAQNFHNLGCWYAEPTAREKMQVQFRTVQRGKDSDGDEAACPAIEVRPIPERSPSDLSDELLELFI